MSAEKKKVNVLAEFLRHQHIVKMALADFASRCEIAASIPAITQGERDNRASHGEMMVKAREAYASMHALAINQGAFVDLLSASRDAATILQDKAGPLEQETPRRLFAALARIGGDA
jgi:hypothetical protein